MSMITNIAAYCFAPLGDLKRQRERLLPLCKQWQLKGTILLSTEGINLFVAGGSQEIEWLLEELAAIPQLGRLAPKYSESREQPFTRMLIRIKQEIIAFGVDGIDPARCPSPKLSPRELKRWLDEGRPITLLDTRNDYEVKLGTFTNAVDLGIDHFREFPAAVQKLSPGMKQRPVVMFCTGGIRCEKAGPFMQREGFEQIYQLEGGILKYFEECGTAHYRGECFVFDQRVGLDPSLQETSSTQCYVCQSPLSAEDQRDARYQPGRACPYCYRTPEEEREQQLAARQAALDRAACPLPGSMAYDNHRPLYVPAKCEGFTLHDFLTAIFPHIPRDHWNAECEQGRLLNAARESVSADQIIQAGERYWHWLPNTSEPAVNAAIRLLHEDEAIIVIDKPAPLPMHPCGRFNRNTLQYMLNQVYDPQRPRPVHRLDANTTGVVVLARTKHFAQWLQPQFTRGTVRKEYWARVSGHPPEDRFQCEAPISQEASALGSRTIDVSAGLPARTDFQVLQRFADGTSLVAAYPLTGRTNQIRLHLWHMGWPILGEQAYLPERQRGFTQTHHPQDAPLCLHALSIELEHPLTRARVKFSAPEPSWL